MEQTIIPQLQLDGREQPLLINPDRIWWKAHQLAPLDCMGSRGEGSVFKQALLSTANELMLWLTKNAGIEHSRVTYRVEEVPGVKDLYKIEFDYSAAAVLAPRVISLQDPRRISDNHIMWRVQMQRLAIAVGDLKLPNKTDEELDKTVKYLCCRAYVDAVFRGYKVKELDRYSLEEHVGDDWKQLLFIRKADGKQAIPFRSSRHGGLIHVEPGSYEVEPAIVDQFSGHLNQAWIEWYKKFTGYTLDEALGQAYLRLREFRETVTANCRKLEMQLGLPPEVVQE